MRGEKKEREDEEDSDKKLSTELLLGEAVDFEEARC